MNFKRRKLKKGNRVGCCRMCALRKFKAGNRNCRLPTLKEQSHKATHSGQKVKW